MNKRISTSDMIQTIETSSSAWWGLPQGALKMPQTTRAVWRRGTGYWASGQIPEDMQWPGALHVGDAPVWWENPGRCTCSSLLVAERGRHLHAQHTSSGLFSFPMAIILFFMFCWRHVYQSHVRHLYTCRNRCSRTDSSVSQSRGNENSSSRMKFEHSPQSLFFLFLCHPFHQVSLAYA